MLDGLELLTMTSRTSFKNWTDLSGTNAALGGQLCCSDALIIVSISQQSNTKSNIAVTGTSWECAGSVNVTKNH